jgi:hypothetical protein
MIDLVRHPRRAAQVVGVLVAYFLAPRLGLGSRADVPGPVRLRQALERLPGQPGEVVERGGELVGP